MDFALALHALALLYHRGGNASSSDIAANACVNPVQVRRVLGPLVEAGLIEARRGAAGGYALTRNNITLKEITDALSFKFLRTPWKTGDESEKCLVSAGMGAVTEVVHGTLLTAVDSALDSLTLADVEQWLQLNASKAQASSLERTRS